MALVKLCVILAILTRPVTGAPDNRGTEFILGFMANYQDYRDVEVFVTTSRTTSVSVQITTPRFSSINLDEQFEVTAGEVKQVFIPNSIRGYGTELSTKAIHVTASDEVVVYGLNKEDYSNDAYLAYPLDVIGDEYYAVTHYPSEQSCELLVIGAYDNTEITITYANNAGVSVTYNGVTYGPGDTQTLTMNKFDTFQAQTQGDLTGTHVTGTKNFVFFSGNKLTNINPHSSTGSGGTRDTLVDQLLPVKTWGTEFGIVATPDRTTGDQIKIVGSEDGTSISLVCADGTSTKLSVNAGSYAQYVTSSNTVCRVKANKPVMVILFVVSQLYSNEPADPALITIPPFEQFAADYTFATPEYTQGSYNNYFMFIVKDSEKSGLKWNGASFPSGTRYMSIPNTEYVGGYLQIPEGTHTMRHDSPISVFGGFIYGSATAESYGMPTGLRLAPINSVCTPTVAVLGDGIDNDCDGLIDEEVCDNVENVALGKKAYQPNLWNGRADWDADKGVDGNRDSNIYNNHCFHLADMYEPWWYVDLGGLYILTRVEVYNREDCCITRARNVEIATAVRSGAWSVAAYYGSTIMSSHTFDLNNIQARYVKLTLKGITEHLQLCEIEVYGKADDDGDGQLDEDCALPPPVHGGWGSWGAWSSLCYCNGQQPRERACDNPAPAYDGNQCVGDAIEYRSCTASSACPVDGGFTSWSTWSTCSQTCGTGQTSRSRSCTNPVPANGGKDCDGDTSETKDCFAATACPTCADNLCVNAVSCTDKISGGYTCTCQAGWAGDNCDQDIDECSSSPCQNGGVCNNGQNGYTCSCSGGWTGTDCEQDVDECSSSPCQNGAACTNGQNQYSCTCTAGWTGTNCDQDINECSSSPCQNGAVCNNLQNAYSCTCAAGYEGTNCETEINECASSPCANGATCNDLVNRYTCSCAPGWEGTNCDQDIDECSSSPCQNGGVCNNGQNGYTCSCFGGWTGTNCEQDVDECSSSPCQNGAACTNGQNQYSCTCTAGWTGTNCDQDVDECSSSPCQNGAACTNGQNQYSCTCTAGWTGTNCDQDINECSSSPCQNRAVCNNLQNAYSCTCAAGYEGTNCETDINECASSPCANGATCNDLVNRYTCSCAPGWEGTNCDQDIDECSSSPCQNGATCHNNQNSYTCTCVSGYEGTNCDTDVDECASSPCQNGATCNDLVNEYTCSCSGGWQGTQCEQDIDECSSGPCVNGTCNNLLNAYSCTCFAGYTARNCDYLIGSPMDGNWGSWQNWQGCSVTCGTGIQRRYRACDDPAPDYGGKPCDGDSFETQSCSGSGSCPTPVDGNWGAWSSPSACSATCGQGLSVKVRYCDDPAPSNGGKQCTGDSSIASTCTAQACNTTGSYNSNYVNMCPNGYFTCLSGRITCVQELFVCDCASDCDDDSDELPQWAGCETFCSGTTERMAEVQAMLHVSEMTQYHSKKIKALKALMAGESRCAGS